MVLIYLKTLKILISMYSKKYLKILISKPYNFANENYFQKMKIEIIRTNQTSHYVQATFSDYPSLKLDRITDLYLISKSVDDPR